MVSMDALFLAYLVKLILYDIYVSRTISTLISMKRNLCIKQQTLNIISTNHWVARNEHEKLQHRRLKQQEAG